MNINELILLYVVGTITREQLEKSLKDSGLDEKIVTIHMRRADNKLAQVSGLETRITAVLCDGGSKGA